MQKTPFYRYAYSPIRLPDDFPVLVGAVNRQGDKRIEYLHSHDVMELGLCLNGSGIFVIEDKVLPFNAGSIAVITSAERHLAQSSKGTVSQWYWIYADIGKLLFPVLKNHFLMDLSTYKGRGFKNILSASDFPYIFSNLKNIINVYENKKAFWKEEVIALFILVLISLKKDIPLQNATLEGKRNFEPDTLQRLQAAIEFIAKNYHRKIYLKTLAGISKLSITHFQRLFENALAQTPFQYLNQVRINMAAAELRQSRKPIGQIALGCGFPSISSFNRHFKKMIKMSPREWRREKL